MTWSIGGMESGRLIPIQFTPTRTLLQLQLSTSAVNGLPGPNAVPHVVEALKPALTIFWMEHLAANLARTVMVTNSNRNATPTHARLIVRASGVSIPIALPLVEAVSNL